MKKNIFTLAILSLFTQFITAQDSVSVLLNEVHITDYQLENFSRSQKTIVLNDSIINKNQPSLTNLLNYNTLIYFKENGAGMVSSPSFRGTTTAQTAIIWNGININSQFLGQVDFNIINTSTFNNVSIKSGGGSVVYGSSAIGGSIHLNNELHFKTKNQHQLKLFYGSYNTLQTSYQFNKASEKYSLQIIASRNQSDNDYHFVSKKGKNLNGEYFNNNIGLDFGYKINDSNQISFYSNLLESDRHFSLIIPTETPTKYIDITTKNLLEWKNVYNRLTSKIKTAHIYENYKFYSNINNDNYSYGKANTYIFKYDGNYSFNNTTQLNTVLDYTINNGKGSDLSNGKREIFSWSTILKQQVNSNFYYEAALRKEATTNYPSPWLYSAGLVIEALPWYNIKINGSKNFRIPTFNDLFYNLSGTSDLKPETSYQGEITNQFKINNFRFELTGFYNDITDMIRWVPAGAIWRPTNTDEVEIFGIEIQLNYQKKINEHYFNAVGNYGYTSSKNKLTQKQLTYTPNHKATGAINYQYKNLGAYYQYLYVGEVFTRTDNNSRYNVKAYQISNIGLEYSFTKKIEIQIGAQLKNIFNVAYQSVEAREMPGRNFNVYCNFKL